MNLSAILLAAIVSAVLAGGFGYDYGMSKAKAQEARDEALTLAVSEAAATASAQAISKLKTKNTIIKQEIERVIQTNTVHRECVHPDGQLQLINEALTGDRAVPAGDRILPKADTHE